MQDSGFSPRTNKRGGGEAGGEAQVCEPLCWFQQLRVLGFYFFIIPEIGSFCVTLAGLEAINRNFLSFNEENRTTSSACIPDT